MSIWLSQLFSDPATGGVLVLVAIVAWATSKVTRLVTRLEKVESGLTDLKIQVGSLEGKMQRGFAEVKQQIAKIAESQGVVLSNSPLVLSDIGKSISKELYAEGIVKKHADELEALMKEENKHTRYDLQRECFYVADYHLADLLSEKQLAIAKNIAFKFGFPLYNVFYVVAILLRDKLFAERGWSLEEESPPPSE